MKNNIFYKLLIFLLLIAAIYFYKHQKEIIVNLQPVSGVAKPLIGAENK